MNKLFKTTLNYSNSGKADWLRKVDWYSIPIREIVGIEGKKQARFCPLENVIELAPDDNFPVLFGVIHTRIIPCKAVQEVRFAPLLAVSRTFPPADGKRSEKGGAGCG